MGRKSLAQIEQEKQAAANSQGQTPVDSTAGTPQSNTIEGQLQKESDAENNDVAKAADDILNEPEGAGGDRNPDQENDNNQNPDGIKRNEDGTIDWAAAGVEPLENGNFKIKGVEFGPDAIEKILIEGTVVDGVITMNPDKWEQFVVENAEESINQVIEQSDIDSFPYLEKAGIKVGDTRPESIEKFKAYLTLIGAELTDDNEQIDAKIAAYEASLNKNDNSDNADKYVYHADHLSKAQVRTEGIKTTHVWEDVTAPDHLLLKPE